MFTLNDALNREYEAIIDSMPVIPLMESRSRERRKAFVDIVKGRETFGGLMCIFDGKWPIEWIKKVLLERYKKNYPNPITVDMSGLQLNPS